MLPLDDTSFLPTEQLRTFFRNQQYIFAPILIMEDDEDDDADYMQYSKSIACLSFRRKKLTKAALGL
jgi:hypothetical protein